MVKSPKILYFISGPVPNKQNQLEADALRGKGATVSFRNARFVDNDIPEQAEGVTGAVPELFKQFPTAEEAMKNYATAREADTSSMGSNAEDNLGDHTLPNTAQTPVRAAVRDNPGETQMNAPVPAKPADAKSTTTVGVENLGAPANNSGQPLTAQGQPVVAQTTTTPGTQPQPAAPGTTPTGPATPAGAPVFNPAAPPVVGGK